MTGLFLRVLILSLTCSVVLLPLLLLGGRLRGRYAAKTMYFLWLALGLRMLLPISLTPSQAPVTVEVPAYTVHLPTREPEAPVVSAAPELTEPVPVWEPGAETVLPEKTPVRAVELTDAAAAVWVVGIALFLIWHAVACLAARRRFLLGARGAVEKIGGAVVYRSAILQTPVAMGLLRPAVFLPERGMSGEHLAVALEHELCHIRRRDLWYKAFLLLVNAVHWFNPLVWLMTREAGRSVELCCDDEVLQYAGQTERKRYGEVLLHAAAGGAYPALSTQFGSGKGQLRERLANLFQKKKNSAALVCAVLAVALLAGSMVACESRKDAPLADGQYYMMLELANDGQDLNALTQLIFSMAELDVETMAYSGTKGEPYTLPLAKSLSLRDGSGTSVERLGDFLAYFYGSSYWPVLTRVQLENGAIVSMEWVPANPATVPSETQPPPDQPVSGAIDRTDLEACTRQAVLDYGRERKFKKENLMTASHITLKTEERDELTTVYAMALYLELGVTEEGVIQDGAGGHMPVAITFRKDSAGVYKLEEYWIPQDGAYYGPSIEEKFPSDLSGEVLDTQRYIVGQIQSCYAQAVEYFKIDTDAVVEKLLNTILSNFQGESGVGAYIEEGALEYRELVYYSGYTLDYCRRQFEQGGQTDLKGAVMAHLCRALLGRADDALPNTDGTGQGWYDAYVAHAGGIPKDRLPPSR